MAVGEVEPKAKSKGIDYSKFDNIEDSDDEKPHESTKVASTPKAEEKPHCANCSKDIVKPLRCGVCKKVSYCSAQCQKEDWQFHKRVCQAPPKEKEKEDTARKPPPPADKEKPKKKSEDKVVDDEDEKFDWYRHREWKPTAEPKKDFRPEQIAEPAAVEAKEGDPGRNTSAGSAWNAAGTWEEKDVTELARTLLKDKLCSLPDVEAVGGSIALDNVDSVEGDASKPVIRGKMRHMFDLSFKVPFIFRWMDASGRREAKGKIEIADFTNDTFAEGVLSAPDVKLSFADGKLLDQGRRKSVEDSLGTAFWPPSSGTAMALLASRMEAWAADYVQKC